MNKKIDNRILEEYSLNLLPTTYCLLSTKFQGEF